MIFRLTSIFVLILLCSCTKINPNLNVKIIGHSGSGLNDSYSLYSPNSYESVENALVMGVDGVEVDLQVSFDSVGFLIHDFRSVSNEFQKYIHQASANEIRTIGLTELNDLQNLISSFNAEIHIDLKLDANIMDVNLHFPKIKKVLEDFSRDLNRNKIYVYCGNEYYLKQLKTLGCKLILKNFNFSTLISKSLENELDGVLLKKQYSNQNNVDLCRSKGLIVGFLNFDNFQEFVSYYNQGPDFIVIDNIHNGLRVKQ